MPDKPSALNVVLCWHMHQPEYRDTISGKFQLPWTYLHAIKDYVDMAAILEDTPKAKAVINFVPILLDQIVDYQGQIEGFLSDSRSINDPLLAALAMPSLPTTDEECITLIKACLRANQKTLIDRYPPYKHLAEIATFIIKNPATMSYLVDTYLSDILVWYHLAWLGETVRRENKKVQQLIEKGEHFSIDDRRHLLAIIGELLEGIVRRYRTLAEKGQVELSMTPYAHAMSPLMLDFNSAREAMPDVDLPENDHYPGGAERVHWHIREGLATFKRYFGFEPQGCWPAEGGISNGLIDVLQDYPITWIASGETVLNNSIANIAAAEQLSEEHKHHHAYRVNGKGPACFFRDDGLSDLIGFTYSDWHSDDAVNNLIHHLENIAKADGDSPNRIVSIILDGENAWEYYPENGYHFLSTLYQKLADHPNINLTTFSEFLSAKKEIVELPSLVAGSWVHGSFSTWIGDSDKNRGWDLLCEAKRAFDRAMLSGKLSVEQQVKARQQMAVCEGSDWFWWFGDYNPTESVSDFEHLFRLHLANLYQLIGAEPPEHLTHVISHGKGQPQMGGVMRTGQAQAS